MIAIVGVAGFGMMSVPGSEFNALKLNDPMPELNGVWMVYGLAYCVLVVASVITAVGLLVVGVAGEVYDALFRTGAGVITLYWSFELIVMSDPGVVPCDRVMVPLVQLITLKVRVVRTPEAALVFTSPRYMSAIPCVRTPLLLSGTPGSHIVFASPPETEPDGCMYGPSDSLVS